MGSNLQCRNARRTGGIINKSLTTVQDIYFAHTCALGGANSVASMMFEIWTRHESKSAQAQDLFWLKRTQQSRRMARVENRLHGSWVKNDVLILQTRK